ncbi:MAG: hypothetical protein LBI27_01620 [Clostridiales bacterium]|jgi:cell division protein FtsL|nr:hypothetical protein [Clostridiales bacterium]
MKRKKTKRPRTVASLAEREKEREKTRPPKPEPPKPRGKLLRFPNAGKILVTRDTRFIEYRENIKNFPWKKLTFTFFIIFIGGIGSTAFHALNANIQNEINLAEREIRVLQEENVALNARLHERYTFSEIERIASEQLGMSFPDASQIIEIDVPRVGAVTLNASEHALPQQNYFWNDVSNFFSGIRDRIFGS